MCTNGVSLGRKFVSVCTNGVNEGTEDVSVCRTVLV